MGEYGAIGFDPYCLNNNEAPIIRTDGTIDSRILPYLDFLKMINGAMPAILANCQTDRLQTCVQEQGDKFQSDAWVMTCEATRESLLGFIPFQVPSVAKINLTLYTNWVGGLLNIQ